MLLRNNVSPAISFKAEKYGDNLVYCDNLSLFHFRLWEISDMFVRRKAEFDNVIASPWLLDTSSLAFGLKRNNFINSFQSDFLYYNEIFHFTLSFNKTIIYETFD